MKTLIYTTCQPDTVYKKAVQAKIYNPDSTSKQKITTITFVDTQGTLLFKDMYKELDNLIKLWADEHNCKCEYANRV